MKTRRYGSFLSLGAVVGALILGLSVRATDDRLGEARSLLSSQPASLVDYIGIDERAEPRRGSFNANGPRLPFCRHCGQKYHFP